MTEKTSASTIIHNLHATLLLRVKWNPILLFKRLDKSLQEGSIGHLAGTIVVDVGNCAAHLSVKPLEYYGWEGMHYSKYSVDPGPRDPATSMISMTAFSFSYSLSPQWHPESRSLEFWMATFTGDGSSAFSVSR